MKKYEIVASLNSENGTEVAKLAIDFDIPTTTLTTVSKKYRQNNFTLFLIRVYAKTRYSKRQS